ncbi:MAG: hypothetical protein K2X93_22905 [Candidatus Obscuribacterales bacterium]|nr:hypothetical protein [Candidatus Obscuribacterales bacterium]
MKADFLKKTMAVLLIAASIGAAQAAPIQVEKGTDSGIEARVKTETLGFLKVPNGSVKFSGKTVLVGAVPEWLFDRHVVLKGQLIKHSISTAQGTTSVQGLVYFNDGDWINSFPKFKTPDNVQLSDGSFLVGRIRAVNPDGVDFQVTTGQTRRIKNDEISALNSPRAFSFTIPATGVKLDPNAGTLQGEADSITFKVTDIEKGKKLVAQKVKEPQEPKSVLAGAEGGVTKGQLTGMIMLDAVNTLAPFVVAPIVAPLGAQSAENRLRQSDAQALRDQVNGSAVPTN